MSQGQQQPSSTVLVFEPDPSLRRLITLGLLHRGLHVMEADSLSSLEKADVTSADLLIVDVDDGLKCNWELLDTVQAEPRFASVATITLAWELPIVEESNTSQSHQTSMTFLPKPFDARTLHETVDALISARRAEQKAKEEQMEAVLLAAYSRQPGPSMWPFLTAVGLFLLVAGILLQVALAVFGGLIVVAGLLLWTLSGPPAGTRVVLNMPQS